MNEKKSPNNRPSNLKAFCQRCHMLHDRPEHQRRRWFTLFRRRALGDLYQGRYQAGTTAARTYALMPSRRRCRPSWRPGLRAAVRHLPLYLSRFDARALH